MMEEQVSCVSTPCRAEPQAAVQIQDKPWDITSASERAEGTGKLVSGEPEGDRIAKAKQEGGDSGRSHS